MKRILDTVHGYIMVEDHFIKHIIDTRYFQRLRRIEQTSIRSVYPSARHDRFIHSLGVYHIGSLIVEHLKKEAKASKYWGTTEASMSIIYDSYLAACLLHDIGHAPFSHTFEHFFGQKSILAKRLKDIINNSDFSQDLDLIMGKEEPNYHEFMSAIVTCDKFKEGLSRISIDCEFVARMITGTFYQKNKETHQIHNCFISLLHGNIIDADRLDYACRDVWASGYSTSSIDLRRLISALHIVKSNDSKDYVICFESNSLNEIDGVLNVKDFQVKYVINHHAVNYEQWLLEQAARKMALNYYPNISQDENGFLALGHILNEKAITDSIILPDNKIISNISDDDLVFLMKQHSNNYYDEWSSRQYTHFPLWKSRDEFSHYFNGYDRNVQVERTNFEGPIKALLTHEGEEDNSIIITKATFKPRVKMNSLYIMVANQVVRYTDIYPASQDQNKNQLFYYVSLPKREGEDRSDREKRKMYLIQKLRPIIIMLFNDVAS